MPDKVKPSDLEKQILYRDARLTGNYDQIWQSVGKCVFCELNEKYILFEEQGIVLTVSLFAYSDGHMMIIPRRHVKSVKELTQEEWEIVRKFIYIAKRMIKKVHGVKGMQLIQKDGASAQSTVDHLHFHCVPFDNPELTSWNYTQLRYTPLESIQLYKKSRKKLLESSQKFADKYTRAASLPMALDLIIQNEKHEILFEERHQDFQVGNNYITLPGGMVSSLSTSFEQELAREVAEETGLKLDPSQLQLIASRPGGIDRLKTSKHLMAKYKQYSPFFWNTYKYTGKSDFKNMTAGDDALRLIWVPLKDIESHSRISPECREIISRSTDV